MPPPVRRVRTEELAELDRLVVRAYTDGGPLEPTDAYVEVLARGAERSAIAEVYVIESPEGGLAATMTVTRFGRPYCEVAGPGETELRMLAVHPDARGRGLAGALVDHGAELAREAGDHALAIAVSEHNPNALAMYEHLGFERAPDRDVFIEGHDLTLEVLTLDVTQAR